MKLENVFICELITLYQIGHRNDLDCVYLEDEKDAEQLSLSLFTKTGGTILGFGPVKAIRLSDGRVFPMADHPVPVCADAKSAIRQAALDRLTETEKKLLGLTEQEEPVPNEQH